MASAEHPRRALVWSSVAAALAIVSVVLVVTLRPAPGRTSHAASASAPGTPSISAEAPGAASTVPAPSGGEPAPSSAPPSSALSSSAPPSSLPPRPPDKPGPVVLVPGYGGDASMLDPLASLLRKAGRTTITLALPDGATGDLRGQEQVLAAEVSRQLAGGAASVDLVGYSAGGIVVALYAQADPSHVRRVVTLGSPLHGTTLAGLAAAVVPSQCPTACQQMTPGSALVESLRAPEFTGVPWLSMWTSHDEVVMPADSARFDGAQNIELQSICSDDAAEHVTLPRDPLAEGLTLRALDASSWPLPSPAAADCATLRALAK